MASSINTCSIPDYFVALNEEELNLEYESPTLPIDGEEFLEVKVAACHQEENGRQNRIWNLVKTVGFGSFQVLRGGSYCASKAIKGGVVLVKIAACYGMAFGEARHAVIGLTKGCCWGAVAAADTVKVVGQVAKVTMNGFVVVINNVAGQDLLSKNGWVVELAGVGAQLGSCYAAYIYRTEIGQLIIKLVLKQMS